MCLSHWEFRSGSEVAERQRTDKASSDFVPSNNGLIAFAGWMLDVANRQLIPETGATVHLTPAEARILRLLARHQGRVVSRDALMEAARGRSAKARGRTIDVHIKNLRRKLDASPDAASLIRTEWGVGYVLVTGSGVEGLRRVSWAKDEA